MQFPDDLCEKSGLLLIRFDQGNTQTFRNHTDWYGGEAGTRANVGEPTMPYGDDPCGEHALAKMEAQDLVRIGDRREGSLLIPAQQ